MTAKIGKILSNLIREKKISEPESKIEIRKNENVFATRFSAINEDSKPLANDYCLVIPLEQIGKKAYIGIVDPNNPSEVNDGEKKIYSRKSDGSIIAFIHLKNDGSLEINANNNLISIDASGNMTIDNNLNVGGDLEVTGEITCQDAIIGGIRFSTHIHGGVEPGSGFSEGPSSPPP